MRAVATVALAACLVVPAASQECISPADLAMALMDQGGAILSVTDVGGKQIDRLYIITNPRGVIGVVAERDNCMVGMPQWFDEVAGPGDDA